MAPTLSRTVMTFLDFPLSLEQSITRTWQSKPLCKMNLLRDIFICADLCHKEDRKERQKRKDRIERGRLLEEQRRSGSLNSFRRLPPGIIFSSWQFPWTCEQHTQLIVSAFFFFFKKTLSHRDRRTVKNRRRVSVKKYKMITPKVYTASLCQQCVFCNLFIFFFFFVFASYH